MTPLSQDWVPLWTAVAALAASVTALVTIAYAYFTLNLVRAQGEPKVIVYVRHDFDRPSVLTIVIENIGRDIAHDVRFTSSKPIPSRAYGIEPSQAKSAPPMQDGPLVSGIPSLGPGDARVISWGQYGGLSVAIGSEPIRLTYTYRYGRRSLRGEAQLEVQSYINTDASERPLLIAARSLKEISKSMSTAAADIHALRDQSTRGPDDVA